MHFLLVKNRAPLLSPGTVYIFIIFIAQSIIKLLFLILIKYLFALEVGICQKFVNRLIGHFFSTINRLIVENMLHNGNNKIYY